MSLSKIIKFGNKSLDPPQGRRTHRPVILADSKGTKLQSQFVHSQQSNITWWCQRGRTIQQSIAWLKANLDTEIQLIGDIWLFVWIGTCNLTSIDKNTRYISLSSFNNTEIIQQITQGYKEIIDLLAKYPNCRVTFLETPFYSIINWNTKQHHKDPTVFSEQEHILEQQVIALNKEVKAINTSLHSHSPDFNYDLYRTSKYRSSKHKGSTKQRKFFNIALYPDGIHPDPALAKAWLRKILQQIFINCWSSH
ncbi:unnamed protein product [Mytilus edulis]|uniref:Uncharacterized protein n=1 Tax=Mytilus edulis TaxID=6550 RepID=A0A8S3UAC0_MYTED|nr:unnamed protein product [Mytilus edulis]